MGIAGRTLGVVVALWACAGSPRPQAQEAIRPPLPYEDVGGCPFEGCVYREWIANKTVRVRETRSAHAKVVFTLKKGDRVNALTGVVVTLKAGTAKPFSEGTVLHTTTETLRLGPKDTLYLLTPRGEGSWTGWYRGRVYDGLQEGEFEFAEKPNIVWWIRLVSLGGVSGWTDEPARFDNKDQLGDETACMPAQGRVPARS
jgi:hypothetical protein